METVSRLSQTTPNQINADTHEHWSTESRVTTEFRQATTNPGPLPRPMIICLPASLLQRRRQRGKPKLKGNPQSWSPPPFQILRIAANGRRNFKIPPPNERDPPPFQISNPPTPTSHDSRLTSPPIYTVHPIPIASRGLSSPSHPIPSHPHRIPSLFVERRRWSGTATAARSA